MDKVIKLEDELLALEQEMDLVASLISLKRAELKNIESKINWSDELSIW